jgi:hypothetical protein
VFLFLFSFPPSLLLDSLIVWEWLYGHRRKKGGQVRKSLTVSFPWKCGGACLMGLCCQSGKWTTGADDSIV